MEVPWMKILHVIFSCNRIKYLTKTLESWKHLDYGSHQVDRLLIDDYPRNRNEAIFELLGKTHNFCYKFNEENLGLSVNWSQFFDWLKDTDYDYVLHQEDDVLLTQPIKIDTLIEVLESDPKMASVVLQRQPWYFTESDSKIEPDDVRFKEYYGSRNEKTFPIIFSLYRRDITKHPFQQYCLSGFGFSVLPPHTSAVYTCPLEPLPLGAIAVHMGETVIFDLRMKP